MVGNAGVVFRTVPIERGDIISTIGATGTLEPEERVDIGAQVAGLIVSFGTDANGRQVDYNSIVEKDMVLATIDPETYKAAVDQAEAALDKSEADLAQYEAKLEQTKQEWKRAESLRPTNAIAETDYDTAVLNYKVAEANVRTARAAIKQNEAALRIAKRNLDYTIIKSPVCGTILDRRVEIGQTVVASLSAPSLFLIAKDLRRMQVWASVNETDIGQIKLDMPATFTVDAYPGRTFQGTVTQVRKNASMTQNIVTYTVIVTTENPDDLLLPYMTASVKFELDHRQDVLAVPNAALRWSPQKSHIAGGSDGGNAAAPEKANADASAASPAGSGEEPAVLWTPADDGHVRAITVAVGPTDGSMTQVSGPDVKDGLKVVIGEESPENGEMAAPGKVAESGDGTKNPFMPTPPKGSRPPPPM
jgi:HlyD family secretion protein